MIVLQNTTQVESRETMDQFVLVNEASNVNPISKLLKFAKIWTFFRSRHRDHDNNDLQGENFPLEDMQDGYNERQKRASLWNYSFLYKYTINSIYISLGEMVEAMPLNGLVMTSTTGLIFMLIDLKSSLE